MTQLTSARLSDLPVGARCIIQDIQAPTAVQHRLCALGFCRGAQVRCVGQAPLGDPRAYELGGAVLALRRVDAAALLTEWLP